jgi:hypothetical protein
MRRLVVVVATLSLLPAAPAFAAPVKSVLGIPCTAQADGVQACIGDTSHRVRTWDGVPLDVDVYLPPADQTGPFPTIFFLHGFGGSKTSSGAYTEWARDGYAIVQYSARGFGNSCGTVTSRNDPACVKGWAHLGDVRYEARDTQYLAGLLADAGVASPQKIGVSGTSYGAGQSLELATLKDRVAMPDGQLVPWTSPKGTPMAIAASAPNWAWSDLAGMLIPNGHTLDYLADASYGAIGMPLESYVGFLFAAGGGLGYFAPPGIDFSSDADTWVARFLAGDPYDDATSVDVVSEIRRYHSPLGIERGLPPRLREQPAAVFDNTSWTDDLTRTTEILRWRNDVLSRYPRAETDLLFSNGAGHPRAALVNGATPGLAELQKQFFDRLLKGAPGQPLGTRTYTQTCDGTKIEGPFDTRTWAAQHPGEVRLAADPARRLISGSAPDQFAPVADPFASTASSGCATTPAQDSPLSATYRFPAATRTGYTLMGAPTIIADLDADSPWAQLDARLWDVAPGGNQTLVSRVAYRPMTTPAGRQVFQLQANGWRFAAGHVPKLELLGQDAPYVRQSNTPFTITISNLKLRLPVRERPDGVTVRKPARPLSRTGKPIGRCARALAPDLRAGCAHAAAP